MRKCGVENKQNPSDREASGMPLTDPALCDLELRPYLAVYVAFSYSFLGRGVAGGPAEWPC